MKWVGSVCFLLGLLINSISSWALEEAQLEPSQDNTLYETPMDTEKEVLERSNGAGSFLFAGRTGFDAGFRLRRTLLKFDLTVLPPGAVIVSARLRFFQSRAAPNSPPAQMALHPVQQEWGEGSSDAIGAEGQGDFPSKGDATWHHRIYPDQVWDSPGGSFDAELSAQITIGEDEGYYTWNCTPELLADLQNWFENPELNNGWIVVGGELAGQSAHRFNSRENPSPEERPVLTLVYHPPDFAFADGFESGSPCK